MEVKVEVNGSPVSISCTTVDELGTLFQFLENRRASVSSNSLVVSPISPLATPKPEVAKPDTNLQILPWKLDQILERLKGMNAAKVLAFIASQASYAATDAQIKEALPEMTSLAPPMSQISSACKAFGVSMQSFIYKQSKPSKGKIIYRFQLPDGVAKSVLAFPEFTATNWN